MEKNKREIREQNQYTYLLLGPQEVGKTCFMTGMYYTFRSSLNGFSLSCVNEEQRVALNKMCEDLKKGKFPSGTSGSSKIEFILRYAYKKRFHFEWYDYRGKLLEEYGINDSKEYEELVNIVDKSTCIMICLDGTWFSGDKTQSVKKIQDNSHMVNELLNRCIDANKKLPPICIVITKFDLCDVKYEQIYYEAIKESFPLFENSETPVFICPICIGKIKKDTGEFDFNPIDQDVYRPLFFSLWCGYGYKIEELEKGVKEGKNIKKKIKSFEYSSVFISTLIHACKNIKKLDDYLYKGENIINELKNERKELLDSISGSENIYWGTKQTTWKEVEDKWKFIQ